MPRVKKNKNAVTLPDANVFQAYQISAWIPCGNGKFKEVIYRKTWNAKGIATWIEVKAS